MMILGNQPCVYITAHITTGGNI